MERENLNHAIPQRLHHLTVEVAQERVKQQPQVRVHFLRQFREFALVDFGVVSTGSGAEFV